MLYSKEPRKITFWQWICGARITNSTSRDIIKMYANNLISARDARQLLNIYNSDFDTPEERQ
jgi:hypothetical protein